MKLTFALEKRRLDQLPNNAASALETIIGTAAQDIANDVILSFGTSPAGRRYGRHVASAPGYPPNVDTGALRASIKAIRKGRYVWWVQDGVPYGVHLEIGTSRMAARPFLRPVVEAWRRKRMAELGRRIGVALKVT